MHLNRWNTRKISPLLCTLAMGLVAQGCESKVHVPTAPSSPPGGAFAQGQKELEEAELVLGKIALDQQRMPLPEDLDQEKFLAFAAKTFEQAPHIKVTPTGGQDLHLEVLIARAQGRPGAPLQDVTSLTAQLDDAGILRHYAVYISHPSQDPTPLQDRAHQALDALAHAIDQDHWVLTHTPGQILAGLEQRGDTLLPEEAAIRAMRRVREIAKSDPAKKPQVTAVLRRYLEHPQTRVVIAAAGALVLLKDRSSQTALIDAATTLNGQADFPSYLTLLTLMGDLGGEQIAKYVEIVAQGHEYPSVQREAAKIDQRLKQDAATP